MGRGRPRPRVLSVPRRFTGTSRPRACSLTFLNAPCPDSRLGKPDLPGEFHLAIVRHNSFPGLKIIVAITGASGALYAQDASHSPGWVVISVPDYHTLRVKAFPAEREPEPRLRHRGDHVRRCSFRAAGEQMWCVAGEADEVTG